MFGRITTGSWAGRSGADRLIADLGVHVTEPDRFRAEARLFDVDGVQLADWRSSPMSTHRPPKGGSEAQSVALLLVASGRIRYSIGDSAFEGGPGSVHLLSSQDRIDVDLPDATRVLAVRLSLAHLPTPIWGCRTMHSGPVAPSVLTPGFVALLGSLIGPHDAEAPALHRVIALRALAAAVLTEELPPDADGIDGLRRRMAMHIDLHLADPDLGPRSIAEAFGVSLRWVHTVFHDGGVTVAGFIRDSRVDAVAMAVRSDLRLIRTSSLATMFGFAGRDQLTRAFHARYGISVHEYQEIASRGGSLPCPAGSHERVSCSADDRERRRCESVGPR